MTQRNLPDIAYFAGVQSGPDDINPYKAGSEEALEWNIGRAEAPCFNLTTPPATDLITIGFIAGLVIIAALGAIRSLL